jgi:DNA-directed RNA polymerase specialized sigma24 family protein
MRRLSKQPAELDLYRAPVHRDSADLLTQQADLLTGVDRTLLILYIRAGCSFYQLGRVTGMNRSSVGRRIRRIIRRLSDRTYRACVENRQQFSEQDMAVLRDHFIRGLSLAKISRDHGLRYYRVHAIVEKARRIASSRPEPAEQGLPPMGARSEGRDSSNVSHGQFRSRREHQ